MRSSTSEQVLAKDHLLPHYTKGVAWKASNHTVIDRGEGCYVWDTDGNKYLDGLAGLFCTNMGHGRADFAAAAMKQMEKLAYFPTWGYSNPPAIEAAKLIAEHAPGDLDQVFFVNSGSEAVESALKFARNYHVSQGDTARYKVISREWSYHGTTLGALAVTGVPKFKKDFALMMWDGARHVMNTHNDEIPAGGTAADLASVQAIEAQILAEGPETVSLVIAEPVQNGRGALVPPDGYWQELRRICDKYGVLLCADEVINAFGRLGHFTGSERFGVVPDMITFAKGVTSAYQPLGGVMIRKPLVEAIWDSKAGFFNHGSTFGGHPVATAVAVANMKAMKEEKVFENVLSNEDYFKNGLNQIMANHSCLGDVRGTGYFYAVEFWKDGPNRVPLSDDEAAALQSGVLSGFVRDAKVMIRPDDRGATMLVLSPPLVADRKVLDDLLSRVDQIVERVGDWLEGNR